MRPVRSSGPRLRAAGLLLAVLALAGTTTFSHSSGGAPLNGAPDQAAADVLHAARAQLGDGYEWGGNGPWTWDCSGFTKLWAGVPGVKGMPRVSRDQQRWAVPIPREQLLVGDLVFYNDPVDHVGIYAGDGRMVDASSARKGVVERPLWSAGVVRYGRVPRPGMPPVKPWTPTPAAAPSVAPAPAPVVVAPRPAPVAPVTASSGLRPLPGLPAKQKGLSSLVGYRSAPVARSLVGLPAGPGGWSDVAVVHVAWRNAGGGNLPGDRDRLVAAGRAVPIADARIGDLVVYGRPAVPHLGVYVGGGLMVDASPRQGRVVLRPVYDADTVKLVRLG
ncbi:MAG: NlpC/P60 family protein [Frankiaceae bacterium]|nr:NlpC/P60 family protein [Frankiaceae bacterium]